jgi:hypothetical protein
MRLKSKVRHIILLTALCLVVTLAAANSPALASTSSQSDALGAMVEVVNGQLIISDQDTHTPKAGVNNNYRIRLDTSATPHVFVITDAGRTLSTNLLGVRGPGSDSIRVAVKDITSLTVYGGPGDDDLEIDYSNGYFDINITYHGGGQNTALGDSLAIRGLSHAFENVSYIFFDEHDGTIDLDSTRITYTGLEPISSIINATNVTLDYSTTSEIITVSDAGSGQTTVDSDVGGETITFNNPTGTLTINAGDTGINTIEVGALAVSYPANIDINGGDGGDTVNLNGAITFAADKSLTVDAKTINTPNAASEIATSGTGSISLTATRNILLSANSSLTTVNGGITLSANTAGTATGSFNGIHAIINAAIQTAGTGDLSLTGKGGNDAATGTHIGVNLDGAAVSSTGTGASAGTITLNGSGGEGTNNNYGLALTNSAAISSVDAAIALTGQGGNGTGNANHGIYVNNATVSATGIATITANGTGGGTGTSRNNNGVFLFSGSWTVTDGTLSVTGTAGNGNSNGVRLNSGKLLTTGTGAINLTGTGNTSADLGIQLAAGEIGGDSASASITITVDTFALVNGEIDSDGALTIQPRTAATTIGLGGGSGGLNLDDAEIGRLADGFSSITFGNAGGSGTITVNTATFTDPLILKSPSGMIVNVNNGGTDLTATTVSLEGTVAPLGTSSGTFGVSGNTTLASGTTFDVDLNGDTDATTHDKLTVNGDINLNSATLNIDTTSYGTHKTGTITIVNETGTLSGTFNGLAHGAETDHGSANNFIVEYTASAILRAATPTAITLASFGASRAGASPILLIALIAAIPLSGAFVWKKRQ